MFLTSCQEHTQPVDALTAHQYVLNCKLIHPWGTHHAPSLIFGLTGLSAGVSAWNLHAILRPCSQACCSCMGLAVAMVLGLSLCNAGSMQANAARDTIGAASGFDPRSANCSQDRCSSALPEVSLLLDKERWGINAAACLTWGAIDAAACLIWGFTNAAACLTWGGPSIHGRAEAGFLQAAGWQEPLCQFHQGWICCLLGASWSAKARTSLTVKPTLQPPEVGQCKHDTQQCATQSTGCGPAQPAVTSPFRSSLGLCSVCHICHG